MKSYIWGIIAIVTLIVCLVFYPEIAAAILSISYILAGLLALIGGIGLAFSVWYLIERVRIIRAARIEAEKQAHVLTIVTDNQVFIRDTDHKAFWRAAHLDSRVYANSRYSEPTPIEVRAWEMFNTSKRLASMSLPLLPDSIEAETLDLLTVFTQSTQSYAVIGGQQTGKTFQMRHIAHYWLRNGVQPIVIGPKWDRGEWSGCILFGGGGDFDAVSHGIAIIRKIVEKRHGDSNLSHKEHRTLPVIFDDWTPIVEAVDNARSMVLEATTLYASVNILLYFILHSDTANAWGVDRKGAALKDNFIKLFLVPHYDANGLIVRDRTKGYLRFAGENVDRPVRLFNVPLPNLEAGSIVLDAEITQVEAKAEPHPTDEEQMVLNLKAAGVTSYRAISKQVWGQVGQFYNQKIDTILAKYGEK
jgi:hypothetical protein